MTALMALGDETLILENINSRNTFWNFRINNRNGNLLRKFLSNSDYILSYPQNSFTYFPPRNANPSTLDLMVYPYCRPSQFVTAKQIYSKKDTYITDGTKFIDPGTK